MKLRKGMIYLDHMEAILGVTGWVSAFGDPFVLSSIGVTFAVAAYYRGRRWQALIMSYSLLLVSVSSLALKWSFMRARPDGALEGVWSWSSSFPSAHAAFAAAFFAAVAYIISRNWTSPAKRYAAWIVCMASAGAIGTSRLVLNVHWPSDVLAGWGIGLTCFLISLWVVRQWVVESK